MSAVTTFDFQTVCTRFEKAKRAHENTRFDLPRRFGGSVFRFFEHEDWLFVIRLDFSNPCSTRLLIRHGFYVLLFAFLFRLVVR